jgi:hypothetical protein
MVYDARRSYWKVEERLMTLLIRCEKPLRLQQLLSLWRRMHEPVGASDLIGERLERMMEEVQPYREWMSDWEEEVAALHELLSLDAGAPLQIQTLVTPVSLPVQLLPMLAGWTVREREDVAASEFSPLALVWLRERGVRQICTMQGRVVRVESEDGLTLLQLEEMADVPVVRERRQHDVEHVDEGMVLLQANVDDSSPEWLSYVMEQLFCCGANDVSFLPMTMKKSRPGVMLQVLCYQSDLEAIKTVLFRETTTFGLRYFPVSVHRLARRFVTVDTPWGEVPVKLGYHRGERVQAAPEYAVCARLAEAAGIPLKQVYQHALQLALHTSPSHL